MSAIGAIGSVQTLGIGAHDGNGFVTTFTVTQRKSGETDTLYLSMYSTDSFRQGVFLAAEAARRVLNVDHLPPLKLMVDYEGEQQQGSCSAAIATAIVSYMRQQPVRTGMVITGGINRSGSILRVNGINPKINGCGTSVEQIVLPADNAGDLEHSSIYDTDEVPPLLYLAHTIDEVIARALIPLDTA